MNNKYPDKLKPGDTIGIVATSSFTSAERVAQCIDKMKQLGYKVKTASNLDVNYGGFMAGDGKLRARELNSMFADPEVDAIFCMRGGDGSSRIMEYLDYEMIKANPKIFVGYSDVTNLHLAFTQKCGFVTFHGPMVSSNIVDDFDDETRDSLFGALNADNSWEFKNPSGFEIKTMKAGKATGKLIGGNLSLLSASVGTPYEVETEGNILFIEEVCEPMSKIEKWVYHLKNAGILEKCAGIILGQFTDVVNSSCPEFDEIRCISDILDEIDIPVMYNVQSGHEKPMMTLPMGAVCTMDTENGSIIFKVER